MSANQNTSSLSRPADYFLLAPSVSVADPVDGLLPKDVLDDDIKVQLVVWSNAREGNRYQLLWNNVRIGEEKAVAASEQPGDPLELILPKEYLTQDGVYMLSYICTRPLGGGTNTSEPINIEIDRKPPAGVLLAALNFPHLTLKELIQPGNKIIAEIPGYEGLRFGDVIQTFWGSQEGPSHTVSANEVPDGNGNAEKIKMPFERSFLESLGDIEEPLTYTVTDRAGNTSVRSTAVAFRLHLNQR